MSRGFASLEPEQRRKVSAKGGRAAHAKGALYEFTAEERRAGGRKSGNGYGRRHMAELGRLSAEKRKAGTRG